MAPGFEFLACIKVLFWLEHYIPQVNASFLTCFENQPDEGVGEILTFLIRKLNFAETLTKNRSQQHASFARHKVFGSVANHF